MGSAIVTVNRKLWPKRKFQTLAVQGIAIYRALDQRTLTTENHRFPDVKPREIMASQHCANYPE